MTPFSVHSPPQDRTAPADEGEDEVGEDTIFSNPENYTIKHPLQSRWTFWFDNPVAYGRKDVKTFETGLVQVHNLKLRSPLIVSRFTPLKQLKISGGFTRTSFLLEKSWRAAATISSKY